MSYTPPDPLTEDDLVYTYHHVFLPPQLPQGDDNADPESNRDEAICRSLLDAAEEFKAHLQDSQQSMWSKIVAMLRKLLHSVQSFDKRTIARDMQALEDGGECPYPNAPPAHR